MDLLRLQRTAGNAAVQRLLGGGLTEVSAEGPVVASGARWLVDDAAAGGGQQTKSAYLAELRQAVTTTVDAALAGTDRQAADCPALSRWFAYYAGQDAAHVERALRQYAPEVATATVAKDTIPAVCARVARGVSHWMQTGEITEAPAELAADTVQAGILDGAEVSDGGAPAATGSVGLSSQPGSLPGQEAAVQTVRDDSHPAAIRAQLVAGRQPDATGARIGDALGVDVTRVRIHDDSAAATLADSLGARAFTIGTDVGFAAGQYQPGTPVGEALLAHELAHVAQQNTAVTGLPVSRDAAAPLEEDADRSAVGAVISLWGRARGWVTDVGQSAMPRLRSGLRLQRCAASSAQHGPTTPTPTSCTPVTPEQWRTGVTAARGMAGTDQRGAAMTELARQALCSVGVAVHQAGNSHPREEDPADYQETPVVNFDVRLNDKTRWRNSDRGGQSLGSNAGHNFTVGSRRFAVIGPHALNENTALTTGQYAQHELDLVARTPEPGQGRDDLELLTWTEDFRRYFHQYGSLPLPQRPAWQRLLDYYEAANARTRRQAIERLVDYFNHPPVAADQVERVQRDFRSWMRRRSGALITDLNAALPAGPTP